MIFHLTCLHPVSLCQYSRNHGFLLFVPGLNLEFPNFGICIFVNFAYLYICIFVYLYICIFVYLYVCKLLVNYWLIVLPTLCAGHHFSVIQMHWWDDRTIWCEDSCDDDLLSGGIQDWLTQARTTDCLVNQPRPSWGGWGGSRWGGSWTAGRSTQRSPSQVSTLSPNQYHQHCHNCFSCSWSVDRSSSWKAREAAALPTTWVS